LAPNLTINAGVHHIRGIYYGQEVTILGDDPVTATSTGLKVTGNLIAQTKLNQARRRADNAYPTLLVVANPSLYVTLLPYLSVASYEWKQLQ
ncbi:hypothetical protein HGA88_00005, partial [Candidatus Roizmanbacteria bacterium]|nr:hypothetical protein [Candidatus Roizmanbacteria bacterium]